jgi:hypothetical protein
MKPISILYIGLLVLFAGCGDKGALSSGSATTGNGDPLPSWNDGTLKQAIIHYVNKVTDTASGSFIPVTDRIATFDNDGTLWAERPYVQELFAFFMAKKMMQANPALTQKQPFKALATGDKSYFEKGGEKVMVQLLAATHTGTTEDEFESAVKEFFATARYPKPEVPIADIIYQPQIELLNYLRSNGFKTYICTGGTVEFVRGVSQELYGIPKEQVIGTSFKYLFVDSNNSILREPVLNHFNDKTGKPAGIQLHLGQRPVFACGNEGGEGDIAMLTYSQGSKYPSFQLIVNHNDSIREFSYQEKDNASLNAAAKNNWHVVDMKNDWKKIFPKS